MNTANLLAGEILAVINVWFFKLKKNLAILLPKHKGVLKVRHKYINWNIVCFFFLKKEAGSLATLPIHSCSETWILHNIAWHMQYTQIIATYLTLFPVSFKYLCRVLYFSASVSYILGCLPSNSLTILAMKHSLCIISCHLLHIFYTGHFPQNIISPTACDKQTNLTWFEGLVDLDTPDLLQILA